MAAEQVDVMLSTLSEKKVQKITELFDKTVIQENLDDTNLTEEWEAYHDWLALRTGSAYAQLSQPGIGKHKLAPNENTVSEDSKVGADLEEESKSSSGESLDIAEATAALPVSSPEQPTIEDEYDQPTETKEPESFFSSDEDEIVSLDEDFTGEPQSTETASEPATNRISVNDVLQKEFTIEKLRGGYNENDVDDFLDSIAAFLNEPHSNDELDEKIASVEGQGFHRKKLGSGCNVGEVDAYLDELVVELKARKK